jgi:hypothetical protein
MAATIVRPMTPPPAPAHATTTTTVPPAPRSAPVPAPALAPAPTPAPAAAVAAAPAPSNPGALPTTGRATAWGYVAALTYLQAYAAKGFALECPGDAEGREAIADRCPQAYMNAPSNSYVISGVSSAPIDPFGPCPEVSADERRTQVGRPVAVVTDVATAATSVGGVHCSSA